MSSEDPRSYDCSVWIKNLTPESFSLGSASQREYESVLIISTEYDGTTPSQLDVLKEYFSTLQQYKAIDNAFDSDICLICMQAEKCPWKKLIYSPVGMLNRDYDDVRRFSEAACKGVQRAMKSGAKNLLIFVPSNKNKFLELHGEYIHCDLVSLLGALEARYVPLEVREIANRPPEQLKFSIADFEGHFNQNVLALARAIENGRAVCRDIGGSDPERMAPPNVASYVEETFQNTCIRVEIIKEESDIENQYPLLAAVNRAARGIERHRARVVLLTYEPEGPYETTLVLVGKGVTYDTGGADIKAGGVMAGMHRDKCGAAAVAGFFKVLSVLKPKGIKVLGAMSMVRNSVGSDCYVSDEIITSRCGRRIRIGNTDAEGRMAMADVLCHMKEKVLTDRDPHLFTIATLTGHACLAAGDGYSIVMDNGPAKKAGVGASLQQAGDLIGDMFEVSTIRREDYEFHKGKSVYEDLLQCNNLPSSKTPRGHQTPAAFLIMSSGLDKHGIDSENPLKYCHIDIAASSGPFPGVPTGAPIPALVKRFIMPRA